MIEDSSTSFVLMLTSPFPTLPLTSSHPHTPDNVKVDWKEQKSVETYQGFFTFFKEVK